MKWAIQLFSFSFLGWGLNIIYNSDIFEKFRPPLSVFKCPNLNFRHFCFCFWSPPPLFGTLSQIFPLFNYVAYPKNLLTLQLSFEDFPSGVVVTLWGWGKAGNKPKAQLQVGLQAASLSLAKRGLLLFCVKEEISLPESVSCENKFCLTFCITIRVRVGLQPALSRIISGL